MKKKLLGILSGILVTTSIAFSVYAISTECPFCGNEYFVTCYGSQADESNVYTRCEQHDNCYISTIYYYTYASCSSCGINGKHGKHAEYIHHSATGTSENVCCFSSSVTSLDD